MIMDTARMLGIELSESDEFKNMLNAQKSLTEDTAASAMLNEYKLKQKRMMDLLPHENLAVSKSLCFQRILNAFKAF